MQKPAATPPSMAGVAHTLCIRGVWYTYGISEYELFVNNTTYAVSVLCLRQPFDTLRSRGTFLFKGVRFFRPERGKTVHKRSASTMRPQAESGATQATA